MNGITSDTAFSLFPRATFCERRGVAITASVLYSHYEPLWGRGFTVVPPGSADCRTVHLTGRQVCDRYSWNLRLTPVRGDIARLGFALNCNTFAISLSRAAFHLDAAWISSQLLSYSYTATSHLAKFAGFVLDLINDIGKTDFDYVDKNHYLAYVR